MNTYERRREALVAQLKQLTAGPLGLGKTTSNLFRDRDEGAKQRLSVRDFHHVLKVDPTAGWAEVEGMTTFEEFVDGTLAHGVMPAVVPELKTITIGGATTGLGLDSTAFKEGLVHDTVLGMDILLPDGSVVWATRNNRYADLFRAFPNSYGSLGYALKLRVKVLPVKPFVALEHRRLTNPSEYFTAVGAAMEEPIDFLDGTIFAPDQLVLTLGRFVETAPWVSDYTWKNIYYCSITAKDTDYLTIHDYIWRWDTDWFWASKNVGAQNWFLRRFVYGRNRLGSQSYTALMRWNARTRLMERLNRLLGIRTESVIQDVDIPINRAAEFLQFLFDRVGIRPIWVCPIRPVAPKNQATLYPLKPNVAHINFGFWDTVRRRDSDPSPAAINRAVELKVAELGGLKSLYSSAFYPEDEFWQIYHGTEYQKVKHKYDPTGRLKNLYQKTVLRG